MSVLGFLKNMTLLARKVPGYHSLWTQPMAKVEMQDYELISLIASVLYSICDTVTTCFISGSVQYMFSARFISYKCCT